MIPNIVLSLINKMNPGLQGLQNLNTPDEVAQFLLNSGKVNQNQVNQVRNMWQNPQVKQQIYNRFNLK